MTKIRQLPDVPLSPNQTLASTLGNVLLKAQRRNKKLEAMIGATIKALDLHGKVTQVENTQRKVVPWNSNELKNRFDFYPSQDQRPWHFERVCVTSSETNSSLSQETPQDTIGILATVPVALKLSVDETRLVWPMEEEESGYFSEGLRQFNSEITSAHPTETCSPHGIIQLYKEAFSGNTEHFRMIIIANVYDNPLDLQHSTRWYENRLYEAINRLYDNISSEDQKWIAIVGYLIRPSLYNMENEEMSYSADDLRLLFASTPVAIGDNVSYHIPGTFPSAGIRFAAATTSVAKQFLAQLKSTNKHVFIHNGEGDVLSLKRLFQNLTNKVRSPDTPALVSELHTVNQNNIHHDVLLYDLKTLIDEIERPYKTKALAKFREFKKSPLFQEQRVLFLQFMGRTTNEAEIDAAMYASYANVYLKGKAEAIQKEVLKIVEEEEEFREMLANLMTHYATGDKQLHTIMESREYSAGWFADSNTFINANIIEDPDMQEILQREKAQMVTEPLDILAILFCTHPLAYELAM